MLKTHASKKPYFRLICFLLFLMGIFPMYAQKSLTGQVVDEKGEPLIGVNILKVGSTLGVITDFDGNFTLQAKEGDELSISSIGYITQQIKIGKSNHLHIIMKEDTEVLDEVVVVGYGTMKKRDLTGSVKSVSSETLKASGQNSTLGALRGQNAGVSVTQATGKLGTGYSSFGFRFRLS